MRFSSVLRSTVLPGMLIWLAACGGSGSNSKNGASPQAQTHDAVVLQLNWFHDPTFAGEYMAMSEVSPPLILREGGTGISPVAEVVSARAQFAVIGADIFLQAIDQRSGHPAPITSIFVDFQRNPVGWVLHPDAAKKAHMPSQLISKPSELNRWLFQRLADGTLMVGDKRGTETTSVWVQWARKQHLPRRIRVIPVGFDSAVVLRAPMMVYPVYLNEEPYKLEQSIGRPVIAFDPAVDGVKLYGNVIIVATSYLELHPQEVRAFQKRLRAAWARVREDVPAAAARIGMYYRGVGKRVIEAEVQKTTEFVFHGADNAGKMDTETGGRWEQTLNALQEAGVVSSSVTLATIRQHTATPD